MKLSVLIRSNILLFLIPAIVFILGYYIITNLFLSDKVFMLRDEKLVGSRWFSYKYTENKYFQLNDEDNSSFLISVKDAVLQVSQIKKARGLSDSGTNVLINFIDSLSGESNYRVGSAKALDISILNHELDKLK